MFDLTSKLRPGLTAQAAAWLDEAQSKADASSVPELFPQLPRRIGRDQLGGGVVRADDACIDLDGWRRCDAAAHALLATVDPTSRAGADLRVDLYMHGDLEERTMVLRCLSAEPLTNATVRLLEEVQRTNMVTHFEAAICDSNLAARAFAHEAVGEAGFNRLILKLAFLELPLARVLDALSRANQELSRMLQGLATEREAAGRAVWSDTDRLVAHAPTHGSIARLIGHLEHGDDALRLAAAEGMAVLGKPELSSYIEDRIEREPRADVRAALQQARQSHQ